MNGWHYRFSGHEFEETPGDSEGQGSLMCCSPGGHRVGHDLMTEQPRDGLNNRKNVLILPAVQGQGASRFGFS